MNLSDLDECFSNAHSCDANAVCSNTQGSYICTCKAGFSGDGKSCVGKDFFFHKNDNDDNNNDDDDDESSRASSVSEMIGVIREVHSTSFGRQERRNHCEQPSAFPSSVHELVTPFVMHLISISFIN